MATQKQEKQINNLYDLLKTKQLKKEDIGSIITKGFFYSVDRINQLQLTAFLTSICLKYDIEIDEILERLK